MRIGFRRKRRRTATRKNRALQVESLEARLMLDGEGIAWNSAPDLTLSFAPDGTDVAGASSALYSLMGGIADRVVWQDTILRAFDTWGRHTDAGITPVQDEGQPFGAPGPRQGDPRFGDVRVGAVPLAADVVALSIPNDEVTSGTWTGDILFNTNSPISNVDELFAVALHEAGHVYGLGHSTDPLSPMFQHGIQPNAALTAQDITHLQTLYGTPAGGSGSEDGGDDGEGHDNGADEGADDNLASANNVVVSPKYQNSIRYDAIGRIATPNDVDYFRLAGSEEADGPEVLTVTLLSTGPEFFIPQATVFRADGGLVESRILANGNGELILQIKGADPENDYIVRVESAAGAGSFAVGDYTLSATYGVRETELTLLDRGRLEVGQSTHVATLQVPETSLTHFVLSANQASQSGSVAVWTVVYNPAGDIVYRIAVHPGETRSADSVLLSPGLYRLEIHAQADSQATLPSIGYAVQYHSSSLQIGPGLVDTTNSPVVLCNQAGADPNSCLPPDIIVTDPTVPPTPLLSGPPQPVLPGVPPVGDLAWWYWDAYAQQPDLLLTVPALHNWQTAVDVNQDGGVHPLDALLVINMLNDGHSGSSVRSLPGTSALVDVNNDQILTPRDALLVLNVLNSGAVGSGEGEFATALAAAAAPSVAALTPTVADMAGIYWFLSSQTTARSAGS